MVSSCCEAVTQQASEMQANNISKVDVKSGNHIKMADRSHDTIHHRAPNNREKVRKCGREGQHGVKYRKGSEPLWS